jgi:2-polyprenyl-6-hydroxyphenyl methylase/3-demethylubiquinone-9 3-methyltransferase
MARLVRNNLAVYDELADRWWDPRGPFAGLRWLAASRAEQIRPATNGSSVLVDIACGGGLLQPYAAAKGYVHIGIDLSRRSLLVAQARGVLAVRADMNNLPLADECADVVVAGECLEHVPDPYLVVAECCRILKPGGVLIVDTAANTVLAHVLGIVLLENAPFPGTPPRGTHDHRLFIDRRRLVRTCARHGVPMRLIGLRPRLLDLALFLFRRRKAVKLVPMPWTGLIFQGVGIKSS